MRHIIQALVFDIDGVITDGRKYTDGISQEIKSVAYKDMDGNMSAEMKSARNILHMKKRFYVHRL